MFGLRKHLVKMQKLIGSKLSRVCKLFSISTPLCSKYMRVKHKWCANIQPFAQPTPNLILHLKPLRHSERSDESSFNLGCKVLDSSAKASE